MNVSVALAGTSFIVTPEVDFYRSFIHILLLLFLYYFFFLKPTKPSTSV
jgi:hypothetical protein